MTDALHRTVYFVVLVYCLLKLWAFCEFVVAWNLLNLIELLYVCVSFLLFSADIVFQSLCVFRWFQLSVRCFVQSCCLCS